METKNFVANKESKYSIKVVAKFDLEKHTEQVKEIWLDLEKFESFEEFKKVLVQLFHALGNVRFVDFDGFPLYLFKRLQNAELYNLEDVFDDFKLWSLTDHEMQIAYVKYLHYIDEQGSFNECGERYQGYFPKEEDFAIWYVNKIGLLNGISSDITSYFNYAAYARDLFDEGEFTYLHGYVFSY